MTGIPPLPVSLWVWAVVAHTGGYLFAMTMSAWLVYERFGMRILRTAWFNFDLIWAVALVVSAALIIVL